jgi:hypothetical protein
MFEQLRVFVLLLLGILHVSVQQAAETAARQIGRNLCIIARDRDAEVIDDLMPNGSAECSQIAQALLSQLTKKIALNPSP